jgi:hypothetical protein
MSCFFAKDPNRIVTNGTINWGGTRLEYWKFINPNILRYEQLYKHTFVYMNNRRFQGETKCLQLL